MVYDGISTNWITQMQKYYFYNQSQLRWEVYVEDLEDFDGFRLIDIISERDIPFSFQGLNDSETEDDAKRILITYFKEDELDNICILTGCIFPEKFRREYFQDIFMAHYSAWVFGKFVHKDEVIKFWNNISSGKDRKERLVWEDRRTRMGCAKESSVTGEL